MCPGAGEGDANQAFAGGRIVASRPVMTSEVLNLDVGTNFHLGALKYVHELQVASVAHRDTVSASTVHAQCRSEANARRTRSGSGGIMIWWDQCEGAIPSRILAQWLIG